MTFHRSLAAALTALTWMQFPANVAAAPPLVFVHAPAEEEQPWVDLAGRGFSVQVGALATAPEEVAVVVLRAPLTEPERANLSARLGRGTGVVVAGIPALQEDPSWWVERVGGGWSSEVADHRDRLQGLYFQDRQHPITRDVSNFDLPDQQIWFNLQMHERAKVLAVSYHTLLVFAPQMWTFEADRHRAFVWLQAGREDTTRAPHLRSLLRRGILWASGSDQVAVESEEETQALRYPPHGPVHPSHAVSMLELEPGFDLQLLLHEPDIVNPISIDWDAEGRLWVAQTPEYPFKVDQDRAGRDKITIHSDTDGDGRLDHVQLFATGFELVTSLLVHQDGALVLQPPHLFLVRDTTGDGAADEKKILLTGFAQGDTHAVASNMVRGLDGWIYATLGYSRGHLKSGDGQRDFGPFSEGAFRFRPDGSAVEPVTRKGGNTWGVDLDELGEIFWTQATSGRHLFHVVVPEYILDRGRLPGAESWHSLFDDFMALYPAMRDDRPAYVQVSPTGGITAVAGSTVYTGGAWPDEYHRFHFISEPTYWLSHVDIIEPDGITYRGRRHRPDKEFLAGRDLWFCPIHHRVGPDGALYIVDFYNQAVSHNDIRMSGDYHGPGNAAVRPDRDQTMGRIYRIQHRQAQRFPRPELQNAPDDQLAAALEHPNQWFRLTAQRLLVERQPQTVVPRLAAMAATHPSHLARLHALWTLEQLHQLDDDLLATAVDDRHYGVRRNALRIVAERRAVAPSLVRAVLQRVHDEDPRTALMAYVALQNSPGSPEVRSAARSALLAAETTPWHTSVALGVLLQAAEASLKELLAAGSDPQRLEEPLRQLTRRAINEDLQAVERLVVWLADAPVHPELKATVLSAMAEQDGGSGPKWNPRLADALQRLMPAAAPRLAASALTLATRWSEGRFAPDHGELIQQLGAQLADPHLPADRRLQAARILLDLPPARSDTIERIVQLLPAAEPHLGRRLAGLLGEIDAEPLGRDLVRLLPELAPAARDGILEQLLSRPSWTRILLDAVAAEQLPLGILGPTQRHRLTQYPDASLAEAARHVFRQATLPADEVAQLIARVSARPLSSGDAAAGQEVFKLCLACHTYGGQGTAVGPDITGIGAHHPGHLLNIILNASARAAGDQYTAYTVETDDGRVHMGVMAREDADAIVLRAADGVEQQIARADIAALRSTGRSLMPEFAELGEEALLNLLSFLRGPGRYRMLDLTGAFTADSTQGMWGTRDEGDSLQFVRFGTVTAHGVPFEIVHPSRTANGSNVITLRGGREAARNRPAEVSFAVGTPARRLHLLGGVGAWAYPWGGEQHRGLPVMQVTLHFAGGLQEEHRLINGEHFADWVRRVDVPKSAFVPDVTQQGQVRLITLDLQHGGIVERVVLRSCDNHVAPAVIAATIEMDSPDDDRRSLEKRVVP